MEQELVIKFLVIAAGIFTGGGLLVWFAKLMASRLIKQYDDKHAEHEKRLRDLADKFAEQLMDLKLKIARLEPMVSSAVALRDDLKAVEGEVAVLEHKDEKRSGDINLLFNHVRTLTKKLEH